MVFISIVVMIYYLLKLTYVFSKEGTIIKIRENAIEKLETNSNSNQYESVFNVFGSLVFFAFILKVILFFTLAINIDFEYMFIYLPILIMLTANKLVKDIRYYDKDKNFRKYKSVALYYIMSFGLCLMYIF